MKLEFAGTGAADWEIADYKKNQFFRRNAALILDEKLLVDAGPHIHHYAEYGDNPHVLDSITDVVITHTHRDHFDPATVTKLCQYGKAVLHGDSRCLVQLGEAAGEIIFTELPLWETKLVGDYAITALRANHTTGDYQETPRAYCIEKDEKRLFYGCDGAWLCTDTMNWLQDHMPDLWIFDLTCGEFAEFDYRFCEHNSIYMLEHMLTVIRKYNWCPHAQFMVSHMARTLHTDHETLVRRLEPLNVTPAFDGLQVEL